MNTEAAKDNPYQPKPAPPLVADADEPPLDPEVLAQIKATLAQLCDRLDAFEKRQQNEADAKELLAVAEQVAETSPRGLIDVLDDRPLRLQ
jgi:hypothetical protein